jgi:protein SCO1/2
MKKPLYVIAAILTLSVFVIGCGSDQPSLQGMTRESPLVVGGASLPEEFENGAPPSEFTFVAKEGELLVVFFGYTMCPDICPTSLTDFRSALRRLGDRAEKVDLAFVTVDPERDTVDKLIPFLSTYASRYHAIRTSDFSLLKLVQDKFLVRSSVTTDENGYVQVTHTGTAFVVDSNGVVVDELPFGIGADGMENDFTVLFNNIENGEQ